MKAKLTRKSTINFTTDKGKIKVPFPVGTTIDYVESQPIHFEVPVAVVTPPARRLFAAGSFWNTRLVSPVIHPNSANMVTELARQAKQGGDIPYYAGFNTTKYSTPLYIVKESIQRFPIAIPGKEFTTLHKELQKGVPIPVNALPAAGTDGHMTIWDWTDDTLYELWQLKKLATGWTANWGGIIKSVSTSNGIVPPFGSEMQGATATSLPVIGGTILIEEARAGVIPHVLALSIPQGPNKFVWPALRTDTYVKYYEGPSAIPAGTRFFLPQDAPEGTTPIVKMMIRAAKDYGLVVRDRAGSVSLYGEDTTQYGEGNQFEEFYVGKQAWSFMQEFPWGKLQVLA